MKTLIRIIKDFGKFFVYEVIPDSIYVRYKFWEKMGYRLNLANPKSLNEKIQWLKIYDRTDLHTKCADKLAVRDFIKERIGENYLIPLVYHSQDIDSLTLDKFPDYPVILKANHDSGTYFIVKDKNCFDLDTVRELLAKKLEQNYYRTSKEWQYKNIPPSLLIEKLLFDTEGKIPFDYKVHCFHGKPRMIQVDFNRGTVNHRRNWYNINWEREPYYWSGLKHGIETIPADFDISPPKNLKLMLDLSARLSEDFKYVRVDWYDCEGKLYFGELTFHHESGFRPVTPFSWDLKLGELIKI